jgi:cell division protein FtsI (penicillin-binding protein 3)
MDTRARLTAAASVCLLPLAPLSMRLAHLQVMEHKELETRASSEFSRSAEEVTPRADLLDRNGHILAQSVPVWTAFVDRKMEGSVAELSAKLAPLVKLPASEVARRIRAQTRFSPIKNDLTFAEASAVRAAKLSAVGLSGGQKRFYPNGDLARGLLGQLSADGRPISGVELTLDKRLVGKPRRFKVIRDGSGKTIHKSVEDEAPAPDPVRLTIDRNIQFLAEEALGKAAEKHKMGSGLVAIQDPANGEILALATYPPSPLKNPIIQDTYEPGSTFKVVTVAAALEERAVKPEDKFYCENGEWEIAPGVVIHDHEKDGELTVAGILEHSSNIGAAKIVDRLGALKFYRAVRAFGFAAKTGVSLPGETAGDMRPLSDMNKVALAAASYGYGIGVSALQVLGAYSAIANGGTLWEPLLVMDQRPSKIRRVASEKTIKTLSTMLEGIVERGTAATAKVPGYRLAGKTGTARKLDPVTKKYSRSSYNASFAGFLPASKPLWTILVVIEDPKGEYYGAQVAAPVFSEIGKRLLALKGVAPDAPPSHVALGRAAR